MINLDIIEIFIQLDQLLKLMIMNSLSYQNQIKEKIMILITANIIYLRFQKLLKLNKFQEKIKNNLKMLIIIKIIKNRINLIMMQIKLIIMTLNK